MLLKYLLLYSEFPYIFITRVFLIFSFNFVYSPFPIYFYRIVNEDTENFQAVLDERHRLIFVLVWNLDRYTYLWILTEIFRAHNIVARWREIGPVYCVLYWLASVYDLVWWEISWNITFQWKIYFQPFRHTWRLFVSIIFIFFKLPAAGTTYLLIKSYSNDNVDVVIEVQSRQL